MEEENFPVNWKLSDRTMETLRTIKLELKDDIASSDPTWALLFGKRPDKKTEESEEEEEEEEQEEKEEAEQEKEETEEDDNQYPSTQFYFTQTEKPLNTEFRRSNQKFDTIECLCEGLERPNGKLDFLQLESLSEEELSEVASNLRKKLTVTGLYNLFSSLAKTTQAERLKYSEVFYTLVLLPKIIELEEPSRLLCSAVAECTEKFPDDIQQFIFTPLLNVELKDTSMINAILNGFNSQRNAVLVAEYLQYTKELRSWHIPILHSVLSFKMDKATKDEFIKLFLDKATRYVNDKEFGKLVLSFIKVNGAFTEEQKASLREIINIHQTLFKKLLENMLNKM